MLLGAVYLLTRQGTAAQVLAIADTASEPAPMMPTHPVYGDVAVIPAPAIAITTVSHQVGDAAARQQLIWSSVALAAAALFAAVVGWWTAARLLRPVQEMTTTARRIGATNLDERLNAGVPRDELTELGRTFDELLDRLQSAFDGQRRFVANASHELRTPLAVQRAPIQIGLSDPSPAEIEQVRGELLESNRRSEDLIASLLLLARGQHGLGSEESVDFSAIVAREVQAVAEAAESVGVSIHVQPQPVHVRGDPVLLPHLVRNLIGNAIAYNHPGGTVHVEIADNSLKVRNTGPRLDNGTLAELIEPFRRGTHPRLNAPGSGLGLSIVQAIVSAHDGVLALRANPEGGLTAEVRLTADGAVTDILESKDRQRFRHRFVRTSL
ncbi:sensor histidine kinase [Mycolicibacterium nivoides]|uniref:sensor histidine kinase n=1 Tax=Mycolicibacterium nivoides TaxID=2487344 RepID=UPI0039A560EF